jgi:hypothetical protein
MNTDGGNVGNTPSGIPKRTVCVQMGLDIPLRESQRDSATKPRVAPLRRYPGEMANISTTLKGLRRRTTQGRFVERVTMRPNGQRYDWFGLPQPTLCRASLPFVASAQPRCGCCDFPIRTRGNAGDGVTPGCGAQRRWRWGGGTAMDANRVGRGKGGRFGR